MLEVVDLRQTKSVNNRTLLVLMEYCKHLKQVFLEGCVLVTVTPSLVKLSKERQVSVDLELQTDSDLSAKTPGQI